MRNVDITNHYYLCPLFLLLLAVHRSSTGNAESSRLDVTTPISLLVLGPYPDRSPNYNPGWTGGPALIPAVQLAVDGINGRRDLLPGYTLRLLQGDSGCNILSKAVTSFPQMFHTDPDVDGHVVGIIGPSCSEAAALVGDIGVRDTVSIIQMGIATSPVLTNTTRFKNTFRMLTSSIDYVKLFVKLIEHNRESHEWETFAALYAGERQYFISTFREFVNTTVNIGFSSSIFDFYFPLNEIESRYKVIFVFAGSSLAAKLMCLAYRWDPPLLFPVYQWIFHDRTLEQLLVNVTFTYKDTKYSCSAEQMTEALKGVVLTNHSLHRSNNEATLVDLSPAEFSEMYEVYLENYTSELPNYTRSYSKNAKNYANAYYDAAWAFALSFNATLDELGPQSLVNYSFGHPDITSVIKSHLKRLTFEGLLGSISFHEDTQDSYIPMNVFQFLDDRAMLIGHFSNNSLDLSSGEGKFVAGKFLESIIVVHPVASFIFLILALIILVFMATLHVIYIIFSNERSIKASSPKFSHLMFSGCYLLILLSVGSTVFNSSLFVNDPESRNQKILAGVFCNVVYWMLFIGLSLIMGSLLVQLWRLYRIFNHFSSREIFLSDVTLTLCVLFLVSINVIILTTWAIVDPVLIDYHRHRVQKSKDPEDDPVILLRAECSCDYNNVWLSVLFIINVLVALCIVVLSSLNRGISRSDFKTTKSVNVMVYAINIILVLCIGLGVVLEGQNVHYMYVLLEISSLGIVFVVCVFFFLPPTLPVLRGLIRSTHHHTEDTN